ncbi:MULTISPECIES: regulatory protein RecX [unclassified Rathayibacter]|uniref:regulatory protein RecX n=1 Tax=unclassified Rathayibacter TaxID=2609250 RepID=UPI00188D340D|nr:MULTISPECIES: regulatory protein RecX [unclassified Rathayibacter]MBF4463574.1 regulatory protein RecX [Rathayibacter sp. VKM Ac-2879]MBF4504976.1 regulatory protein RecX [Rathayibacter sp. VKM Ac-2878]
MAFLPWVGPETASEAPLGSPDDAGERGWAPSAPGRRPGASERSAEPSAHVARRLPTFEEAGEGEEADPDGDIIAEVPEEIDPERIADRIVRGLVRKSLSVAEVEARLYAEGVSEKDALEIVERFTRFGYLDDRRMAGQLVVSLRDRKKLGRSLIQQELRARKLDPEAIASALDELDGDDEYRTALDLARKRLPSLRSLSDDVAERRLTGFLARRGYGGALVQRVVRETVRRPGSGVRFR